MDKVFIEGLAVEAVIGIHDWERRVRQALVLDVELSFDNRVPAATDAIADAHDYEAIGKRLLAFVAQTQVKLVETLAERCAALLLEEFGVRKVRLKLTKPGALPGARAVGVVIKRERHRDDEDAEKEDKDEQDDASPGGKGGAGHDADQGGGDAGRRHPQRRGPDPLRQRRRQVAVQGLLQPVPRHRCDGLGGLPQPQ